MSRQLHICEQGDGAMMAMAMGQGGGEGGDAINDDASAGAAFVYSGGRRGEGPESRAV